LHTLYLCRFQAEEFDVMVHSFLDHLSDVERVLKYGVLPEEEEALLEFRTCHQVWWTWTHLLLQKCIHGVYVNSIHQCLVKPDEITIKIKETKEILALRVRWVVLASSNMPFSELFFTLFISHQLRQKFIFNKN